MTSTQNAVARVETGPAAMVEQYRGDYTQLLPSHINADAWIRLATGALRKDKSLLQAATSNPASFMSALSTAARLGLEPGTEQYYLTPRKTKTGSEVLGIVGYQGIIELIYRAGAVSSVIAECVYSADSFDYQPGRDERPIHRIDWDAPHRGELRLVYAYAVMKDGATSKVVVMNKAAIDKVKASSASARSDYSPWSTNPDAMWLKSAVRQLGKWVPTSAEFIREQLRAVRDVAHETPAMSASLSDVLAGEDTINTESGDVYEGVIVDEPFPNDPDES